MESIISLMSETAVEVLKKMAFLDVEHIRNDEPISKAIENVHMCSMIMLDGTLKGSIVFHCSDKLAKQVTCALLGEDMANDIADMDIKDAIGEVTNVIAGNVKNKISNLGHSFSLSSPKVLEWGEYVIELKTKARQGIMEFTSGKETFFIELLSSNGSHD
ncbi:MAG: chemotaxis protein CheX [Candidatus Schekmanbacteria bacterium]|nr:chemotaxis protein CheX [Candidatus Schekmanbacteria bacterium]